MQEGFNYIPHKNIFLTAVQLYGNVIFKVSIVQSNNRQLYNKKGSIGMLNRNAQ